MKRPKSVTHRRMSVIWEFYMAKTHNYNHMKFIPVCILFSLMSFSGFAQLGNLIWEDNFNDGALDASKWTYETGTGVNGDWGTGQLDRATNRIENVNFQDHIDGAEDACLVITTRKEFYIDRNYTSGRINTAGKASWGPGHRIVARVAPRDVRHMGQGFAFWMMPDEIPNGYDHIMWPQGGEIDIMEYVGSIPFHNLGSVHYAWFWENNQWQSWNHAHAGAYYSYEFQEVPNPSEPAYGNYPPSLDDVNAGSNSFHNYGIDWYDDRIEFFVDDNVYHIHYLNDGDGFQKDEQDGFSISETEGKRIGVSEYSNHFEEWHPFEHKMYAILSAGVGGGQNSYGGSIVPEAKFPCSVIIDWVRVYELGTPTVVNKEVNQSKFKIFPNPANTIVNIQIDKSEDYAVKILDRSGRTVLYTSLNQSSAIDVSSLKEGLYLLQISNGKITMSKKLIKL